ncbi:MAG: AAA family ATPase [Gammaproteobacteria bacterium]|nr:AAA family ATPase [Gammaproteobacteria bacterium]
MLLLLEGPAGSGKSQAAEALIASGQFHLLADLTALWAAIRAMRRDAEGRYPVRQDDDPGLSLAAYIRAAVVRQALREDLNVVVTSATPGTATKWAGIAEELGAEFQVRTINPGYAEAARQLAQGGPLSAECAKALARWFG